MDQHPQHLVASQPPARLLSADELAAYLGVLVKTLYQWRYNGVGPRAFRVGRHLRYRPEDVEAWLLRQADTGHRGEVA
jgi:excisionase family DNA binding protein